MKARVTWVASTIGTTLGIVLLLCLNHTVRETRITKKSASAIQAGMTQEQVEGILGPERDETDGRMLVILPPRSKYNPRLTDDRTWVSKHAAITVGFDRSTGRVADVFCEKPIPCELSLLERIKNLLHGNLSW